MNHGIHRIHGMVLLAVAALGTSLAAFAADPALPNIDVASPAEVDIIDAEGVVLDYYEVTVVA